MESLYIKPSEFSPEILLDSKNNSFLIKGNSRPEDVREIYQPVIEWLNNYRLFLKDSGAGIFNDENPMIFQFDLEYFNSSSAKFLYDVVEALKQIKEDGTDLEIAWLWDEEDVDMQEAGEDLSYLAEIDFAFVIK